MNCSEVGGAGRPQAPSHQTCPLSLGAEGLGPEAEGNGWPWPGTQPRGAGSASLSSAPFGCEDS